MGAPLTLTAIVSPTPDAGTIAFSDGGVPIAGCGAVAVSAASPQAICSTSFPAPGQHLILASYSGDSYYMSSTASLNEDVTSSPAGGTPPTGSAAVPVISQLRAGAVRRRLRLRLELSVPARITVVLTRRVAGRVVRSRCRAGAKRGRRCTVLVYRATFGINAKQGQDTLAPRMRPLAAGTYTVVISARDAAGRTSKSYRVSFRVRA